MTWRVGQHITAFVTPVVELKLEQVISQWVLVMWDRSSDLERRPVNCFLRYTKVGLTMVVSSPRSIYTL